MNQARIAAMSRRIPSSVASLVRTFHEHGYECYLVGGAVRNLLRGQRPSDFDFATSALPDQVTAIFRRVIPTGIKHGTVTVLHRGESYEVTTYRTEGDYSDSRRPDSVSFVRDIREDLKRRDFTMNAIAFDPVAGELLDPHGGEADIARRIVRAIGSPDERFEEDALRMLRAVRFAAQLEFAVDPPTLDAVARAANRIRTISHERVRDEFTKLVCSPAPAYGLRLMRDTGLLSAVLPELAEGIGVEQRGNHRFDVFEHSIRSCEAAPDGNLPVRLAALLHDIGKPRALEEDEHGERRFHNHDRISAEMADGLLRRLKYPNRVVSAVTHLVRHHMFNYAPEWTDAAVRRFIARVGHESIADLIALRAADSAAIRGDRVDPRQLGEFTRRIDRERSSQRAVTVRDLAVDGNDLMEAGIPRGPALGVVLEALLETVLDDPELNTREKLTEIARSFYEERLRKPTE